jgi:hypothetical protein
MIPLIPSPGRPKTVFTPQSSNESIRTSAAVTDDMQLFLDTIGDTWSAKAQDVKRTSRLRL